MRGNPTSIPSSFTLKVVYVLHLPFPVSMYRLDWIHPTPPSLADFKFGIGADSHLRRKAEPLFSNRAVALSDISPGPFYHSFPFTDKRCHPSTAFHDFSFLLYPEIVFLAISISDLFLSYIFNFLSSLPSYLVLADSYTSQSLNPPPSFRLYQHPFDGRNRI